MTCASSTSMASSRRPSKLPGARLTEPTMARAPSASIILPCSFSPFSLCTLAPTSCMIRRPPTPSISLSFFSVCGGRARMCTFTPRRHRAHDALDDHRVLVALVLQPQRVLRAVDEMRETLAAVVVAPDEARRRRPASNGLRCQSASKHGDDLVDLVLVRRDDRVVAGFRDVARLPVERHDERGRVVDDHRLLVREVERRIAVQYRHAALRERPARLLVLGLAAAARRVEHHPDVDAALARGDHRRDETRVGEREHLHAQRFPRRRRWPRAAVSTCRPALRARIGTWESVFGMWRGTGGFRTGSGATPRRRRLSAR